LDLDAPPAYFVLFSLKQMPYLNLEPNQNLDRLAINLPSDQTILLDLLLIENAVPAPPVLHLPDFPAVVLIPDSLMNGVEIEIAEQL